MSTTAEPLTLAAEAIRLVQALAHRGADAARVESEIYATITGWIGARGAVQAMEALRDQLSLEIDVTRAELRSDAASMRRASGIESV